MLISDESQCVANVLSMGDKAKEMLVKRYRDDIGFKSSREDCFRTLHLFNFRNSYFEYFEDCAI